ncbi:MAG: type II toxin-antitoxin system VapC family toxin, partial [Spirochaetota bacterium]
MKKKTLLDSFALLVYLKKEDKYHTVKDILSSGADNPVIMNELNIGETYYILARERMIEHADYFIEVILPSLPITIVSNSFEQIIEASRIKAKYPISYVDCFAVATAQKEKAVIVTGDPEFKKVEGLVKIEWV